jgi:hypothetical protein
MSETTVPGPPRRLYNFGMALAGLVFIVAGLVFLLDNIEIIAVRSEVILPAVVLGLGLSLVVSSLQRHRAE